MNGSRRPSQVCCRRRTTENRCLEAKSARMIITPVCHLFEVICSCLPAHRNKMHHDLYGQFLTSTCFLHTKQRRQCPSLMDVSRNSTASALTSKILGTPFV